MNFRKIECYLPIFYPAESQLKTCLYLFVNEKFMVRHGTDLMKRVAVIRVSNQVITGKKFNSDTRQKEVYDLISYAMKGQKQRVLIFLLV